MSIVDVKTGSSMNGTYKIYRTIRPRHYSLHTGEDDKILRELFRRNFHGDGRNPKEKEKKAVPA